MKDQLFTKIVEQVSKSNGRLEWASRAVIPMIPPGDAGHESKALLPSSLVSQQLRLLLETLGLK
jgi:hypothetical protein